MNTTCGKKLPLTAIGPDGISYQLCWDQPIITIEQYEQLYGKIAPGLFQLKNPFRAWKKILLMVDPSMPTWKRNPGAELCHFADILPNIMEFGVAELIIPAGAFVYYDEWMEVVSNKDINTSISTPINTPSQQTKRLKSY